MDIMFNHHTYQCFFNDLEVPAENLVGEEGLGFRYIIDGWNAERILIASEAVGDGRSRGRRRRQKTNIHSRIRGFACPAHCGRPVIGRFPTIDIEKTHIFRE